MTGLLLCAAVLSLSAPENGAFVPLMAEAKKAFYAQDCAQILADAGSPDRRTARHLGDKPLPVTLAWTFRGDSPSRPRFTVEVVRGRDGLPVAMVETTDFSALVDNLEVGCDYRWRVWAVQGNECVARAEGSFATDVATPRQLRWPGVVNVRDLGGRIGMDGRRIRQNRIFRSAGLNGNATATYATNGTDKVVSRTFGKVCLDAAACDEILGKFAIRTDLDLRSSDPECWGMTRSPLGGSVTWTNVPFGAYDRMFLDWGRRAVADCFRVVADESNHPVVFHCIGGADRTGTFAFVLLAVLGVSQDEIDRDWATTSFLPESEFLPLGANLGAFVASRYEKIASNLARYPGGSIRERVEAFLIDCGVTVDEIERFRTIMLEAPLHEGGWREVGHVVM